MEKRRNIITVTAYVLLMLVFFTFGFIAGNFKKPTPIVASTVSPTPAMRVSLPAVIEEKLKYCVKLSDNTILLLRIDNGKEENLYSIEISENIFPADDINELKEGIYFDNIDEAHALIENFVS